MVSVTFGPNIKHNVIGIWTGDRIRSLRRRRRRRKGQRVKIFVEQYSLGFHMYRNIYLTIDDLVKDSGYYNLRYRHILYVIGIFACLSNKMVVASLRKIVVK